MGVTKPTMVTPCQTRGTRGLSISAVTAIDEGRRRVTICLIGREHSAEFALTDLLQGLRDAVGEQAFLRALSEAGLTSGGKSADSRRISGVTRNGSR